MNPPVKYGIIGFGRFAARAIAPAIQSAAPSSLVALQKRSLEAARASAARIGVPRAYDSVQALLGDAGVDAVFITSANGAHAGETVAAARAGKHVIVEKPMAVSTAEAEAMVAACEREGVLLMVGHMVRLSPAVRRVHEILRSGRYGPVTFARADFVYDGRTSARTWLYDRPLAGGGPLFDIGVHCLDTLRYVLDDEVASVLAHLEPPPTAALTETTAHLSLRFSRGTPASIFCSYASPIRRRSLEVICRDAILTLPDFSASGETLTLTVCKGQDGRPDETLTEQITVPDLYRLEVSLFSEAILDRSAVPLPGANGLRNMRVLEAAMTP
ncbi:MAG TPA: Gfo/Idh/MocA family oxidoreductase [Bacteroidota bacterium]